MILFLLSAHYSSSPLYTIHLYPHFYFYINFNFNFNFFSNLLGISNTLSESFLFRSEIGTLCSPKELYDPHVQYLRALLPKEVFPSSVLFSDPSLLRSLRILGMHSSITAEGVLTAARNVQSFLTKFSTSVDSTKRSTVLSSLKSDTNVSQNAAMKQETNETHYGNNHENELENEHEDEHEDEHEIDSMAEMTRRAIGLLQYVENNIENLLTTVDPEGLKRIKDEILLSSQVQGPDPSPLDSRMGRRRDKEDDSDDSPIAVGTYGAFVFFYFFIFYFSSQEEIFFYFLSAEAITIQREAKGKEIEEKKKRKWKRKK